MEARDTWSLSCSFFSIFLSETFTIFLEQGPLLKENLSDLTQLDIQQAPGIFLSSPSQCWYYEPVDPSKVLHSFSRFELRKSYTWEKPYIDSPIFPVLIWFLSSLLFKNLLYNYILCFLVSSITMSFTFYCL